MTKRFRIQHVLPGSTYPEWYAAWDSYDIAQRRINDPQSLFSIAPNRGGLAGVNQFWIAVEDKDPLFNEHGEIAP